MIRVRPRRPLWQSLLDDGICYNELLYLWDDEANLVALL